MPDCADCPLTLCLLQHPILYICMGTSREGYEARVAVLSRVGPAVLLLAALGAGSHLFYLRYIVSSTLWKAAFSWTGLICLP